MQSLNPKQYLGGSIPADSSSSGRVTMLFTDLPMCLQPCDLGDDCLLDSTFHGEPLSMQCNVCKLFLHVNLCDRNWSKSKSFPSAKNYKCHNCDQKAKGSSSSGKKSKKK